MEGSEAGFTGFAGWKFGSLEVRKVCKLGLTLQLLNFSTLYNFLAFCTHFWDFALKENKLTFLWELLYSIKIPCWGALLGPV